MANCKICGGVLLAGPVMHRECMERLMVETAEKFCDSYCRWPEVCGSQEQLHREHCEGCPMEQLMKLVK